MKKFLAIATLALAAVTAVVPTMATQAGVGQTITKHGVKVELENMVIDNEKKELRVQVKVEDPTGLVDVSKGDIIQFDFFQDIKLDGKELNTGAYVTNQTEDNTTVVWDMVYPLTQTYDETVNVAFDVKQVVTKGHMIMDKWQFEMDIQAK
ncbi:MAG: hypothetical protein ACRCW2_02990 [Cellulosilyticaceae bacterium]